MINVFQSVELKEDIRFLINLTFGFADKRLKFNLFFLKHLLYF